MGIASAAVAVRQQATETSSVGIQTAGGVALRVAREPRALLQLLRNLIGPDKSAVNGHDTARQHSTVRPGEREKRNGGATHMIEWHPAETGANILLNEISTSAVFQSKQQHGHTGFKRCFNRI